jgi:acylphosphatase
MYITCTSNPDLNPFKNHNNPVVAPLQEEFEQVQELFSNAFSAHTFEPASRALPPAPQSETLTLLPMASRLVRHFLVKGRVQGVGFRWFVHREAAALSLLGWVRNTEDGHVEVLAAGDPDSLADLALALRKGSRGSRVDAVIEHELADKEADNLESFRIEGAW